MYRKLRVRLVAIALLLAMAAISSNLFTLNGSAAFAASHQAPGPTFTPTVPPVPAGCGKYGCPTATPVSSNPATTVSSNPATSAPADQTPPPVPAGCGKKVCSTPPPVPAGCGKYGCPTATPINASASAMAINGKATATVPPVPPAATTTVPPVPAGCGKYGCPTATPINASASNAAPGPTFTPTVPSVPPSCGKYGCPTATPVSQLPACSLQSWSMAKPGPQSLAGVGATSDGVNVYFAGGFSLNAAQTTQAETSQFSSYNLNTNSWTALADVPVNGASDGQSLVYAPIYYDPRDQTIPPGIGGLVFDFGGGSNVYTFGANGKSADGPVFRNTRVYKISSGQWSSGSPLPAARKLMASGYYQGKIYLAGGLDNGSNGLKVEPPTQLWVYDIATDRFKSKAAMPGPVAAAGYGVINGHLYVAGGVGVNGVALNSLYDYSIAADTWKVRASLPVALTAPGSAVINGKLYLFGGMAAGTHSQSGTYIYDPTTDSWHNGPNLNVARAYIGAASVDNMIVAYGGLISGEVAEDTTTNANEVLNPPSPCPTRLPRHCPVDSPRQHAPTLNPPPTWGRVFYCQSLAKRLACRRGGLRSP